MPDQPLNPDALSRASDTISDRYDGNGYEGTANEIAEDAIRAYLAALPTAQPRTVETVEQLDALPAETVIKAADGNVYEQNTLDPRLSAQWVATGSKYPVVPECVELPATVLWAPAEAAEHSTQGFEYLRYIAYEAWQAGYESGCEDMENGGHATTNPYTDKETP